MTSSPYLLWITLLNLLALVLASVHMRHCTQYYAQATVSYQTHTETLFCSDPLIHLSPHLAMKITCVYSSVHMYLKKKQIYLV